MEDANAEPHYPEGGLLALTSVLFVYMSFWFSWGKHFGEGQEIFENLQFGSWGKVPRLGLFYVMFASSWLVFPISKDQGPLWLQVGEVGQQVHQVSSSGLLWEHGLVKKKYYYLCLDKLPEQSPLSQNHCNWPVRWPEIPDGQADSIVSQPHLGTGTVFRVPEKWGFL